MTCASTSNRSTASHGSTPSGSGNHAYIAACGAVASQPPCCSASYSASRRVWYSAMIGTVSARTLSSAYAAACWIGIDTP